MKKFIITVNGKAYDVEVSEVISGGKLVKRPNRPVKPIKPVVEQNIPTPSVKAASAEVAPKKEVTPVPEGAISISAPMPGKILSVAVQEGDKVAAGDVLCILEAMKMQNEISATVDGVVSEVRVSPNQNVATAEVLIVIS